MTRVHSQNDPRLHFGKRFALKTQQRLFSFLNPTELICDQDKPLPEKTDEPHCAWCCSWQHMSCCEHPHFTCLSVRFHLLSQSHYMYCCCCCCMNDSRGLSLLQFELSLQNRAAGICSRAGEEVTAICRRAGACSLKAALKQTGRAGRWWRQRLVFRERERDKKKRGQARSRQPRSSPRRSSPGSHQSSHGRDQRRLIC